MQCKEMQDRERGTVGDTKNLSGQHKEEERGEIPFVVSQGTRGGILRGHFFSATVINKPVLSFGWIHCNRNLEWKLQRSIKTNVYSGTIGKLRCLFED